MAFKNTTKKCPQVHSVAFLSETTAYSNFTRAGIDLLEFESFLLLLHAEVSQGSKRESIADIVVSTIRTQSA